MKDQVYNAADENQVRDADRKSKNLKEQELEDIRFVLRTRQGRRFVWRVLTECGLDKISANQSGSWTYFNEGQRNIGLILKANIIRASLEGFFQMMKESEGLE